MMMNRGDGAAMMTPVEECLWKELVAIVSELDRVLAVAARDKEWKEKRGVD
jgi:hypothetical protein